MGKQHTLPLSYHPLTVLLDQQSVCSIRKNGPLGKLLQEISLNIWNECTINHRDHVEAVNRTTPHQLLSLEEGKISCPNTNSTSDDIKLDDRLVYV
jgi:hypothetical protein